MAGLRPAAEAGYKVAMIRFRPLAAAPLALALIAAPAAAVDRAPDRTAATDYVLARAADANGDLNRAAAGYAAAYALTPDARLGSRVYRQAVSAGDFRAALAAARNLQAADALPSDGRLLLIAEAVQRRDWARARAALAAMPDGDVFGFLTPIIQAWISFGEGKDPMPLLVPGKGGAIALPYIAEHRALLLIAGGRMAEGISQLATMSATRGGREVRLRLAAAAALDPSKPDERTRALAVLQGDDALFVEARAIVSAGRRLPGAIRTPAAGMGELLTRVAADLNRDRVTPVALSLARIATFLDPDNAESWLVTTTLLAGVGLNDLALDALGRVAADDPFATAARDLRLRLLVREDRAEEALGLARAAATAKGAGAAEWTRVGDILNQLDKPADAADAYGKAIALSEANPDPAGSGLAVLWLLRGGALERAGDWAAARPALEKAVAMAPDSAAALNYLGYARLERGEDIAGAAQLIEKANRLAPDDPAITDSLGWAYYRLGRLPQAISTLEKAVAGEPGDADINDHLGDAYWAAGRRFEARYAWRAASVYASDDKKGRLLAKIENGPPARP
ncbi:tetratricopeptide repeat protein [Sphingomonas quercus]|uniref:Tetratricopeptide repeat protein n=1 Tax=Sphingomonas quercus TaxID=2842451 RepID=A0ABS6BL27_9SPHN|nr:tetratricopeptide repeat protein [Sphingomonas quercus]MBU3079013.1 tetratricopeptide repeat protein [Sphingomonas quercus]